MQSSTGFQIFTLIIKHYEEKLNKTVSFSNFSPTEIIDQGSKKIFYYSRSRRFIFLQDGRILVRRMLKIYNKLILIYRIL